MIQKNSLDAIKILSCSGVIGYMVFGKSIIWLKILSSSSPSNANNPQPKWAFIIVAFTSNFVRCFFIPFSADFYWIYPEIRISNRFIQFSKRFKEPYRDFKNVPQNNGFYLYIFPKKLKIFGCAKLECTQGACVSWNVRTSSFRTKKIYSVHKQIRDCFN